MFPVHRRKTWTLIGAAVGVVVMLMVLTTAACCVYRRRHPRIVTEGFSGNMGNMDNAIPGKGSVVFTAVCSHTGLWYSQLSLLIVSETPGSCGCEFISHKDNM